MARCMSLYLNKNLWETDILDRVLMGHFSKSFACGGSLHTH